MTQLEGAAPVPSGTDAHPFDAVDAAVGVTTRPAAAMREIAAGRSWPAGLLINLVSSVLYGLATLAAPPVDVTDVAVPPPQLEGLVAMSQSPLAWMVKWVMFSPLMLLFLTGVLYVVGRLLGGRGAFVGLLATQGFASVPGILEAPVAALVNLAGGFSGSLSILVALGFAGWTLVLIVLGIRESLGLSTGRAVATVLMPVAILFAFMIALASLFAAWLFSALPAL